MNNKFCNSIWPRMFFGFGLLFIGCGCLVVTSAVPILTGSDVPTVTASPVQETVSLPSETPVLDPSTSTPTPEIIKPSTPTITPSPSSQTLGLSRFLNPVEPFPAETGSILNKLGPWLLVGGDAGLVGFNQDGTGISLFSRDPVIAPIPFEQGVSPAGGYSAYITYGNPELRQDPVLKIINLPLGSIQTTIHLTSNRTVPSPDAGIGDPAYEANRAVVRNDSLAWSPDGRILAFIGASEGTNADLYIYRPGDNRVTRLTAEITQAYRPVWSSDGAYLVYWGVNSFGTGDDFAVSGAWSVYVDGTNVVELYRGGGNAEDFKGWATERKILVSSRNPGCGDFDLRMVNIKTGVQNPVYSACFSSAAIDPETASLIYSITDYNNNNCSCSDQTPKQGVYLNTRERTIPRQLSKENLYDLKWLKDGIVFLAGTGSRWDKTYSSEGEQGELPGNTGNMSPTVSLANGLWAWTGENSVFEKGIWIGLPGEDLKNVFDQVAEWITWSPDGQYLYFGIEDGSTFRAKIPEFTPDYLGKIQGNSAAWIMP